MMWATGRRRKPKERAGQSGFTLIELLIVIAIVASLAGLSFPKFNQRLAGWRAETSCRDLQVFMIYLHERSVIEGKVFYLVIGDDGKKYWGQRDEAVQQNRVLLRPRRLAGPVHIESQERQIAFYPDGSIDKITLRLVEESGAVMTLTTLGTFGSVKIL